MTPQDFIAKWKRSRLTERSAAHSHFLDLCELLGEPKPTDVDLEGAEYTFERGVSKSDGGKGWADVWKRHYFAWEYKGKHKDLEEAHQQLLKYREALENPRALVLCDMDRFQVHTNFTDTVKVIHESSLDTLRDPKNIAILHAVLRDPDKPK